jgi:putative transposase
MIIRAIKLKLTKSQENTLETWLNNLTGVYNWGLRKIEVNAQDKIFFSEFDFVNLLSGHSKILDIPSHTVQGTLKQIHNAWTRCFKKIAKKPHLKGFRNKLVSVMFPDVIKRPMGNKVFVPGIGKIRYHSQELPIGKIKCGRIIKRASGWYMALWIDTVMSFPVKETINVVGIDPGFSTLLTLSDGTKIENPRELRKGSIRLAQAQRGNRKQLAARILERQANRRNDRNHKISRKLVENYVTIYYSDDNFKSMAKKGFGKSVSEASLSNLIGMTSYKSNNCGRKFIPVNSAFTTMTCSNCGSRSGPTGKSGLAVRYWVCSACGAHHDRDINASRVVLGIGLGTSPYMTRQAQAS